MKTNHIKIFVLAAIVLPLLMFLGMGSGMSTVSANADDDAAALYKKNTCFACHKADASKHFDTALTDEELIEVILKGKKGEKPPFMPSYEAKGIDATKAAALVAYMRELRAAAGS
jgi:mono/diheme cytochrome c family protein